MAWTLFALSYALHRKRHPQVTALNGEKIYNLKQLVTMVDECESEYLTFDLDYNQKLVLKADRAKAATAEVLETHCIPSDRSPDLADGAAAAAVANGAAAAADGGDEGAAAGRSRAGGGGRKKR